MIRNNREFEQETKPGPATEQTAFEQYFQAQGVRHKTIRPYTPRHNGIVERSHREDQKRLYDQAKFFLLKILGPNCDDTISALTISP